MTLIMDKKEKRNYRAISTTYNVQCVLSEEELDILDVSDIVNKLNESGFCLGSGHDGIELAWSGRSNDICQIFLTPYVGHMTQIVTFKLI